MTERKRYNFALIGVGRIGKLHFKNLVYNERVTVKYIIEEYQDVAKQLVSKFGLEDKIKILGVKDVDQVYKDNSVDAVMVCSPSSTHEDFVKNSLTADKAVFCEKPLALSILAVQNCYDAAEKAKRPLYTAFQRRFDPQLNKMWHDIRDGKIGPVRLVRSTSRDPPGMTTKEYLLSSGGIFVDSAVHDIDMVNWLVGEYPQTVYASGHASHPMWKEVGDVDTCAALIKYPGGAVALIDVSRNAPVGYDQRVESFGSEGMLQSNNRSHMDLDYRTMDGVLSAPIYEDFLLRYESGYALELEHFLNVLEGTEQCIVTRESTIAVNITAAACAKSMETGEVIDFKEFASLY